MARVLLVLGGLGMGGVETYMVRLARELNLQGHHIDVVLLSSKADAELLSKLSEVAEIFVHEKFSFLASSSWINSCIPFNSLVDRFYDIVHVVDIMTLGFVYFNRKVISFSSLSIGIYHSKEISWWRNRSCYFRGRLVELYDKNVDLMLSPSESVALLASKLTGASVADISILPLGVELEAYKSAIPSKSSHRIISVGRLVDFKTYNKNLILSLAELRESAPYEYYIYGEGPERKSLEALSISLGVSDFVHFKGEVEYSELKNVLNGAFCFIGSGTTIIEASAAGIPSVVGIESMEQPLTCGYFSDVEGFSYNERDATTSRVGIVDVIKKLNEMSDDEYMACSRRHRLKAAQFDIKETVNGFVALTNKAPRFSMRINRWFSLLSFFASLVRFGPSALRSRFDS
ncbi:glycosyltransferase family 4 protein [Stutzerimonas urumqiensis]|uniref:glycosyltransferase family 4 protein n=1 Tax=Stutzerimonas urumqiensis TaxID=638269 RepID=UPI003DA34630